MRAILSLVLLWFGSAALAAPPVAAPRPSPHPLADAYFAVRDRARPITEFDPREIQFRPGDFEGATLEVRGLISGLVGTDRQSHLLIQRGPAGDSVQVALPPGKGREDYPTLDTGVLVRALVRPGGLESQSPGQLELLTIVRESEAVMADQTRAALAEAARKKEEEKRRLAEQRRKATQQRLASRGVSAGVYGRSVQSQGGYVAIYADAVRFFNSRLTPAEAHRIAEAIIQNSLRYGLDARLVMAVIAAESNFNQNAVSRAGAMGLGQLMPGTAGGLGVGNAFDIHQNLEGSTRLLRNHIANMSADGKPTPEALKLALACYNAGAGAVKRHGGVPPYRETQNYIRKITRLYFQMLPDWERREWVRRGWQPA